MNRRLLLIVLPLLWTGVLASAIGVVYVRHEARTLFAELERLSGERDRLNIEWAKLRLEQGSVAQPVRVERVVGDRLDMALPEPADVRIVTP